MNVDLSFTVQFKGINPEDITNAMARSVQTKEMVRYVARDVALAAEGLARIELHKGGDVSGKKDMNYKKYADSFQYDFVNPAEIFKRFGSGAYQSFGDALGFVKGETVPIFAVAFSTNHIAHIIEWGSVKQSAKMIMARAAESLGYPVSIRPHEEGIDSTGGS